MAQVERRRAENAPGAFFVDDSCIDCDTCRWMAPETFHRDGDMSAVHTQPPDGPTRRRALHALLACPTASIGVEEKAQDLKEAQEDFPLPVTHGDDTLQDVFHCGYHARSSFGAASYLLQTPDGNVLVDSPRFAAPLVRRLEALGGVDVMALTHRDDVADHTRFAQHFGCDRVIHADDAAAVPGAERVLQGEAVQEVLPGLQAIPVPGHTKGHVVYLWRGSQGDGAGVLFTGDHLAWSDRRGALVAFRGANWYSWPETVRSMQRLTEHSFEWVLPGHGRRVHLDGHEMQDRLRDCIAWMETVR